MENILMNSFSAIKVKNYKMQLLNQLTLETFKIYTFFVELYVQRDRKNDL